MMAPLRLEVHKFARKDQRTISTDTSYACQLYQIPKASIQQFQRAVEQRTIPEAASIKFLCDSFHQATDHQS
jgi:hypothetical protein